MYKQSDFFTAKKNKVTFILSIMVLLIHISTLSNYSLSGSKIGEVTIFMATVLSEIARVAVPLFFIISAALFYRDYDYLKTKQKLKSRFFSLVIPYLVWNTLCMLFEFICSYTFISNYFVGREKVVISVPVILEGIFFHRFTPFWFIFDLIIFSLLCPLIFFIVKSKLWGAVCILAVFLLNCFSISIPTVVFYRSDSIIYYLLGAYIGVHYFDWFKGRMRCDKMRVTLVLTALLLSCTAVIADWFFNFLGVIRPLVICIYCISFWRSFDIFKNDGYLEFEKNSFLIYAMHINVSAIVTKLIFLLLPKAAFTAPINYVLTVIITIASICIFGAIIRKYLPRLSKILGAK